MKERNNERKGRKANKCFILSILDTRSSIIQWIPTRYHFQSRVYQRQNLNVNTNNEKYIPITSTDVM